MKQLIAITLFVSFYLKSEIYEIRITPLKRNSLMPMSTGRKIILCLMVMKGLKLLILVSRGKEAIVEGTNPIVSPNGQPNVTWVAKYKSREERDAFLLALILIQSGRGFGLNTQSRCLHSFKC